MFSLESPVKVCILIPKGSSRLVVSAMVAYYLNQGKTLCGLFHACSFKSKTMMITKTNLCKI